MDQLEDLVLLPPENYLPTQQVKAVAGGGGGGYLPAQGYGGFNLAFPSDRLTVFGLTII